MIHGWAIAMVLTRYDIAAELKCSPKHAGRLMKTMPRFYIGRRECRVRRKDFEAWQESKIQLETELCPLEKRESISTQRIDRRIGNSDSPLMVENTEGLPSVRKRRMLPNMSNVNELQFGAR